MQQIYNGTVILPNAVIENGRVVCEDGIIREIQDLGFDYNKSVKKFVLPGLVDIHNHGALCHDYMEASDEAFDAILDYLTAHGITSTQCTTVSAPINQIFNFLEFYRKRINSVNIKPQCRLVGIHIEGPFIAPSSRGAHQLDTLSLCG